MTTQSEMPAMTAPETTRVETNEPSYLTDRAGRVITCQFGCHAPATEMRRDMYRATDGGIICEANWICADCGTKARALDASLESRGLLK